MVAGRARASSDWDDVGYTGGAVEYKARVFCHLLIIHHVSFSAVLNIHAHFLFVHVTACLSALGKLIQAHDIKESALKATM
jgi:hypothetical protein